MRKDATAAAEIYLLKVNNRNARPMLKICSKLKIKGQEQQWCNNDDAFAKLEQIS